MESYGLKNGLFFTADPYSKIIDPSDKNTAMLFGDAAAVTLLSDTASENGLWYPTHFLFGSLGEKYEALRKNNGKLIMNGRVLINFAVKTIPTQIYELLRHSNINESEIDVFLFHQGSKLILDKLQTYMNLPVEKVPRNLSSYGNTISSSIPIILEDYLKRERFSKLILSGFGVGLSYASCLLQKPAF